MKKKKKIKDKIIVTGSEGLIGKSLVKQLSKSFNWVKVDWKLGHDLTDEKKVINLISKKDKIKNFLKGKEIVKHIYIKNKLINLVVK